MKMVRREEDSKKKKRTLPSFFFLFLCKGEPEDEEYGYVRRENKK